MLHILVVEHLALSAMVIAAISPAFLALTIALWVDLHFLRLEHRSPINLSFVGTSALS